MTPDPAAPLGDGPISDEEAEPLEGAVEVDWDRPLDEWETAFKDELFYWGPFFRGLGHGHMYLDANAKYALARIAGILHRRAAESKLAAAQRDRDNWRDHARASTQTALASKLAAAERDRDEANRHILEVLIPKLADAEAVIDACRTTRNLPQRIVAALAAYDRALSTTPEEPEDGK